MKRIVILFHERDRWRRKRTPGKQYKKGGKEKRIALIHHLCDAWKKEGIEVLYLFGTRDRPEADLLIPHIDLTHRPPAYDEFVKSYSNVVNRNVTDISKRAISRNLLSENDDYAGPVIVKTDNNCQGMPERLHRNLAHPAVRYLRRAARRLAGPTGQDLSRTRTLKKYLLYPALADVPREVFRNPALVVERFLPEKEGDRFFLRHYAFLGDHPRHNRIAGDDPILKAGNMILVDSWLPVPDELQALRQQLGLDYGKIDYTMHQGKIEILDINTTPSAPGGEATEQALREMAGGIRSLLARK